MGVRGFTTYMSKHSHLFHETFKLKNSYIIIDGSGIAISLYVWHTKSHDCYGGDYDSYANTVYKFFNLLKKCNVIPIILFDGGYENRKLRTVLSRMKSRICSIKKLSSSKSRAMNIFPLFTKEIFQDIALSLGVKCIRNDHESDSEIACLGKFLECPILGYDSDFYFFDTLYIPFVEFQMRSVVDKESSRKDHYIPCKVYKIDKFLTYFGGLNKTNLPLLPVLLGNDYVKKSMFSSFYQHIKIKKSKTENEQQRLIKSVICWLRNESLESAISKILGRFQIKKRKLISFKLQSAMKGYLQNNSTIIEYLGDIDTPISKKEEYEIDISNIVPTEADEIFSDSDPSDSISELSEVDISELQNIENLVDDNDEPEIVSTETNEDLYFIEKYRNCLFPQCFADIKWKNMYFCLPQVENYADPNSHKISLDILACIHKILNPMTEKTFICVLRTEGTVIKKEQQKPYSGNLPSLDKIQDFDLNERKYHLYEILKIDVTYQKFINMFPSNWHIFLLSIYYWKKNSKKVIDVSYIYSLLLCAIVLNFIDSKIGFCRSPKVFEKKYKTQKLDALCSKAVIHSNSIRDYFKSIDHEESLLCMRALMPFFGIQPKKPVDKKLNEASIVGYFSEFQSCVLHIKYLNALLGFPFDNFLFSKFFCGTFLYNTVVDFRRRSNLESYFEILLKDCKNIRCSVQMIVQYIEEYIGPFCESDAKKRKKRKKKQNKQIAFENEVFI